MVDCSRDDVWWTQDRAFSRGVENGAASLSLETSAIGRGSLRVSSWDIYRWAGLAGVWGDCDSRWGHLIIGFVSGIDRGSSRFTATACEASLPHSVQVAFRLFLVELMFAGVMVANTVSGFILRLAPEAEESTAPEC